MNNNPKKLPIGSKIGIIGGGQLGRMMVQAAKKLGYKTIILDPVPLCPAGQLSDHQIVAEYDSIAASKSLAHMCDVVTYEFENVDLDSLISISEHVDIYPSPEILKISNNRIREKQKLSSIGIPTVKFLPIYSFDDLDKAIVEIGFPMVLKTATSGYDGKGQVIIKSKNEISNSIKKLLVNNTNFIVEEFLDFQCELSVICGRNKNGLNKTFFPAENIHKNHILDISIIPPRISQEIISDAQKIATQIAEKLNLIGLLAVEMFLTKENKLLVNELAPRPHNSGHYTMDACKTSQFSQLIRILTNMPLGNTDILNPVVMVNILGDLWVKNSSPPNFESLKNSANTFLHLYGKDEPRIGRKMGHVNVISTNVNEAYKKALKIRKGLNTS